ncbi:MAG: hypothetical protein N3D84_00800, partial [Candidatus Woesearchaeota archaeon]|nr:hypothetical protein [Candidatus Woesearchaeota archaeon]
AKTLKKEMAASVTSYVIFITFIVLIVGPALFGLSYQLLTIVSGFSSKIGAATAGVTGLPLSFAGGTAINTEDFKTFSRLSVGIIATFSSMIISIIRRGDIKGGIKYIPVFLAVSLIDYEIFLYLFTKIFAFVTF